MSDIITTLHPQNDEDINLYPNIKKENIPNKAIDKSKLDDDVNNEFEEIHSDITTLENDINTIGRLYPSGVDTSAHILAFTENKGIYIGSDTGYWYYWNGTQYVSGGVYQATQIADGDAFKPFGAIADNSNLNDYITIGSYWIPSTITVTNKPDGISNGMLLVFTARDTLLNKDTLFQLIINETGVKYIRRKYDASWTNWSKENSFGSLVSVSGDLNNYTEEGSYWIPSNITISNKPSGLDNGCLIVFTQKVNASLDVTFQVAFDNTNIFIRRKYNSWNSWSTFDFFKGYDYVQTDFNNYTEQGSYWIPSNTTISNKPTDNSWNGMLLVFKANFSGTIVIFQIAFNENGIYYIRRKFGSNWTSWSSSETVDFQNTNISNKKWYACGDSFTMNGYTSPYPDEAYLHSGKYSGQFAVYPFYIGNRTNCDVHNVASGGMTLSTYTGGTNCFTYNNQYQTLIPVDAELVTLYFGINDNNHNIPIGSIDDVTTDTFYGAWNVVLSWLLENRPNAKIGVIITNGCDSTSYPEATIAICKKWGISYLDINGDDKLPMVIRTNMRTNLSNDAYNYWLERYRVSETNTHPNYKAHEDESYMIQQFLERL